MALRTTEDDDTRLNPGQTDYDQKFNDLARREEEATFNDIADHYDDPSANISNVDAAEKDPGWEDKTTPGGGDTAPKKVWYKGKRGPIALILSVVFGGAVGIGFFGGSSLFLVNITEIIQNKFNTSVASLDNRSNKIIALKTKGTTTGVCSSTVSVLCKYRTLSTDEIQGFKDQGITIKDSAGNVINPDDNTIRGKSRPATYTFEGKDIPASEYPSEKLSNPRLRSAEQAALKYNAKYASVSGKIWSKVSSALKVAKKAPFDDTAKTDDERLTAVQSETKNGVSIENTKTLEAGKPDPSCRNPQSCTQSEVDSLNDSNAKIGTTLEPDANSTTKAVSGALEEVGEEAEEAAQEGLNTLKVTGSIDQACSIYGTIKAVSFAAKTVRAAQLARYAMVFLTTASMIKAGTAKSEDVAFLASTLTALYIYKDLKGNTVKKSATDSLAYRNAAFGDTGKLDLSANQFLTGGGLVGDLDNILNVVLSYIPGGRGSANTVCGVLGNPFIQGGSVIVGIAAWIFPGTDVAMGVKEGVMVALGVAGAAASIILPGMLKDIIAGQLIDKSVVGEAAGDALVSGAGSLLSTNAQYSGNAPLTPTQAVGYNDLQTQVAASYAQQDRIAYSPLDASNPNTFLGTVLTNLSQYSSSFSSISAALGSSASIISKSFGSLLSPQTKAASTSDYTTCQDMDYQDLGIATDLFCNPVRGIPPEYLNAAPDPDVLTQQFIDAGQVDEATGEALPGTDYATFITNCIDRSPDTPLGDNSQGNNGSGCIIKDQKTANWYIHTIDQRALDQMENGMNDEQTPNGSNTDATAGATIDQAHLYEDSTTIACAAGTTDSGTERGYDNGNEIGVRLCVLPNTIDEAHAGQPAKVNSRVSGAYLAMTTALYNSSASDKEKQGGKLKVADSFRTNQDQQVAFARYGAPRAAKPGFSNHQMGLAIDFQLPSGNEGVTKVGDPVYDWLAANANTYGFKKLSTEAWHWQAAGAH